MTHFTKAFCALLLTTTFLMQSCKKTDQSAPAAPDVAASLQNKNWKIVALTVSPAQNGTTDIYNTFLDACNRDDLYIFYTNNYFEINEGPTKCDPVDPQKHNGIWNYNSASKILFFRLDLPADEYNLMITQIDAASFTGVEQEVISGVNYTYTWNFAKQ